jgi:hypothetical protein
MQLGLLRQACVGSRHLRTKHFGSTPTCTNNTARDKDQIPQPHQSY